MKKTILLAITLLLSVASLNASMDSMLRAISSIESGHNKLSNNGVAITQYQITRVVWEQHSKMRWSYAKAHLDWKDVQDETERVARAHVRWIAERLDANGKTANPFTIAMCWRGGVTYYLKGEFSADRVDYANRAANLYFRFEEGFVTNINGFCMNL